MRATLAALATVLLIAVGQPAYAHHQVITVHRGDTLSSLAESHGVPGGWTRLAYRNRLDTPDLIHVGQRLIIPHADGRRWRRPASASRSATRTSSSVWDRLANCESGGDWSINTGNGYYGGLQFSLSSWRAVGGTGYPHHHSRAEQIHRAELLKDRQGWGAWPTCSAKLGLR